MNTSISRSATMALIAGVFLPIAETVRRIEQIVAFTHFFNWFDDYVLGGLLIAGAVAVRRNPSRNSGWLIAVWGVASGALFLSAVSHLQFLMDGEPDPGIFPSWLVLLAKVGILVFMVLGLWLAVKGSRSEV